MRSSGDDVLRYLRRRTDRETADDVFSDTMLVAWRRFDDIPDDAIPWLIVTARNCLLTAERSTRRRDRLIHRITTIDPPSESYDTTRLDGDGGGDRVRRALTKLNAADAELVRMWAWDEMSLEQIAAVLNVTTNAATIRLHRAKRKLQKELSTNTSPTRIGTQEGAGR